MKLQREKVVNWIYVLPLIIIFLAFMAFPVAYVIRLSFNEKLLNGKTIFVGLENYRTFFTDGLSLKIFINTAIWVFAGVFFKIVIGLGIALVLNKEFKLKGICTSIVLIPWAMPVAIACLTWRWIYNPLYGYLNSLLQNIGVIAEPVNWLGTTQYALASVILVNVWAVAPFCALNLLSVLYSVPNFLYEAATIDGAGPIRSFCHITLPLIMPTIKMLSLLIGIWGFNSFDVIYMMTEGGPLYSSEILVSSIYKNAFMFNKLGYSSAIATVSFIILSIFSIIYVSARKDLVSYE